MSCISSSVGRTLCVVGSNIYQPSGIFELVYLTVGFVWIYLIWDNRVKLSVFTINLPLSLFHPGSRGLWTGPCLCPAEVVSSLLSLSCLTPPSWGLAARMEHCSLW